MNGNPLGPGVGSSLMAPPSGPSPTATPPQEGLVAGARAGIADAVKTLMDTLGVLKGDMNNAEGKAILKALNILAPVTPEVSEGISRSAIMAKLANAQAVRPGNGPNMLGTRTPQPNVMAGPPLGAGPMG